MSSLSESGRSPDAKRYLVHFRPKNASGERNLKGTFTKNIFVFSLFRSNNATSLGGHKKANITSCNIMLHFVTVCTIRHLLLVATGHCFDCCESVSHRLTAVTCDHQITTDNT